MNLEKYNLGQRQMRVTYDLLKRLYDANQDPISTYKFDAIKVYIDEQKDIYISYFSHGLDGGVPLSEIVYWKIDANGDKVDIKQKYNDETALIRYIMSIDEIK
jgi:hypothetical protein